MREMYAGSRSGGKRDVADGELKIESPRGGEYRGRGAKDEGKTLAGKRRGEKEGKERKKEREIEARKERKAEG